MGNLPHDEPDREHRLPDQNPAPGTPYRVGSGVGDEWAF